MLTSHPPVVTRERKQGRTRPRTRALAAAGLIVMHLAVAAAVIPLMRRTARK